MFVPVPDVNKNNSSPSQIVVGPLGVMIGAAGAGFTVTTTGAEGCEGQPVWFPTTEYEPEVVIVIDCVVDPVDQVLFGSEEVNVTFEPSQIVVDPDAEIVGIADTGITVTLVVGLVLEHPFALVYVTAYAPLTVALMLCVFPPSDHVFPLV